MATLALLVHSPLVGPATLEPLGRALHANSRGWTTLVPDLREAVGGSSDLGGAFVDRAVAALAGAGHRCDVLVGHSGGGAFLPAIAAATGAPLTVFLDAVLPATTGTYRASAGFIEMIDALPRDADGRLPRWSDWWPDATLERLLPDPALRARIVEELPRVPRSLYDETVELPTGWSAGRCAYLQLSPGYDEERGRATELGWPAASIDGRHLDAAVDPVRVADHLVALVDRLR